MPLLTLTVPTPELPKPTCHAVPVTRPPATFNMPVPLAPSWKMVFWFAPDSTPVKTPLLTFVVMLSGM